MADGRITIDTKIDARGVVDGTDKIMASLGNMAKEAGKLKQTVADSFSAQTDSIMKSVKANKEQKKAVEEVSQAQKEMSGQQVPTEEYKKLVDSMKELKEQVEKITKQQQEWLDLGVPAYADGFDKADKELENLYASMKKIQQQQEEMKSNGTAFIGGGSVEAPAAPSAPVNDINGLSGIFSRLKEKINEYSMAFRSSSEYINFFKSSIGGLSIVLTRTIPVIGKFAGMIGKTAFTGMISGLKNLAKAAQKASLVLAQLVGRGIVGGLKKITAGIFGMNKATNKSTAGFGASLKTMLKYTLGIRSLYALVGKLRSALVEGFKNLAQYSDNTNATISGLISSLDQCKNALATAFDPILQAVAPALEYLINLVTAAATAVSQLIAILTGKGTFIRATKIQKDYAKSLAGTGGAAKKAGEEAEGALAPFDKLNVMAEDAVGGGGGGGGMADISPADMFETVEVGDAFKELSDLFKSQDWKGIGKYVAEQLNEGLQKIYDVINWDNVGPRITYFVNAFTETFNSLVDNLDWDLLGRTMGAGVNTVVNTLNLLVEGIDWENIGEKLSVGFRGMLDEIDWTNLGNLIGNKFMVSWEIFKGFVDDMWRENNFTGLTGWEELGKSLGEGLNGIFEKIDLATIGATLGKAITGIFQAAVTFAKTFDWNGLGENISNGINEFLKNFDAKTVAEGTSEVIKGILDTLITAIENTDWNLMGSKLAEFLKNIDWDGIADRVFEGIGAALGGLAAFFEGLIGDAWDSVVKWWKENAYEDGQFTMQGLLDGIVEALKNIGTWIKEHIFEPFIKGFKAAFGIHSPSTVMKEMGGFLMDGLKNGISNFIPNVIQKFTELKDKIVDKWDEVKQNTAAKWEEIKGNLSEKWNLIKGNAGAAFNTIKQKVSDMWGDVKSDTSSKWDSIKSTLFDVWDNLKEKASKIFKKISEAVKEAWGNITDFGDSVGTAGRSALSIASSIAANNARSAIPSTQPVALPRLASGTVVPPRAGEFAAILGDNNREAEVVSPLSTMKQAVLEAIEQAGGMGGGDIIAYIYLDGKELGRSTVNFVREEKKRTGRNPLLV